MGGRVHPTVRNIAMLLGRRLLGARQLPVGSSVSQIQCCGVVGYQIRQVPLRSLSAATVTTAGNAGSTTLCFGGCPPPVTKLQLRSLSSSSPTSFPSPSPSNNQVSRWGPDRILPASGLTTSWPDGRVEIRGHPTHPSSSYPTMSVWTMLRNTVARVPNRTTLAV